MSDSRFDPSFEDAIAQSQGLIDEYANGKLSPADWAAAIGPLVQTLNGARGFFVAYLTADRPLADVPGPETIAALDQAPAIVPELLVKNLAMATAMALTHDRAGKPDLAQLSRRTAARSAGLIAALGDRSRQSASVLQDHLSALTASAQTGTGAFAAFLDRWGYDEEQRSAINEIIAHLPLPRSS